MARRFGGAGDEWARGLAVCGDGSVVALSSVGPAVAVHADMYGVLDDPHDQPFLAVTKLDATGGTLWSRTVSTGGAEVRVDGVGCARSGEAYIALWAADTAALDLGAGPVHGAVIVKLTPCGDLEWQRALPRRVSSLGVGAGGLLLGMAGMPSSHVAATVEFLEPDGTTRWRREHDAGGPQVAIDATGDAIVAADGAIWKIAPDGKVVWRAPCNGGEILGVAADGTVYAKGVFIGGVVCGDIEWDYSGPGVLPFVAAVDANGRPLWLRGGLHGAMGVEPDGSAVTLGGGTAAIENDYALDARYERGCGARVIRWDFSTGTPRWQRFAASCDAGAATSAAAVYLAMEPGGDVWIQGDAEGGAFDLGEGPVVPAARDWFVVRIAR